MLDYDEAYVFSYIEVPIVTNISSGCCRHAELLRLCAGVPSFLLLELRRGARRGLLIQQHDELG